MPVLDVLDFDLRKLVQRFTVPQDLTVVGAWVSNAYYIYGYRQGTGQLWHVNVDRSVLEGLAKIDFPAIAQTARQGCKRCSARRW
jgi:hypothetical protein